VKRYAIISAKNESLIARSIKGMWHVEMCVVAGGEAGTPTKGQGDLLTPTSGVQIFSKSQSALLSIQS